MYYKNYWLNYNNISDFVVILEMTEDMTDFKNSADSHDFEKVKNGMLVKRVDYENVRDRLDENGLFIGIFPPEVIEEDIKNFKEKQEKKYLELKEKVKEKYREPWDEDFFIYMKKAGIAFDDLIRELQVSNEMTKDYWGKEYPIEEYYMDYIVKYWPISFFSEE